MIRSAASAAPTAAGTAAAVNRNARDWMRRKSIDLVRAGDEAAAGGERLRERAHPQVDAVLDAEQLGGAGAARAEHAGAVRLVDHQPRAVGAAQLGDLRQRRDVALHREDAVDDDEHAAAVARPRARACFSSLSSRLWRNGRSLARDSRQPSRIEAWSPESAITVSPGREDRAERADVGLVAGGEDERVLGAHPLRDLALELEVQVDRAVEQARAGQAGAVALERVARARP